MIKYSIDYTKAADKFLLKHEDVRDKFEEDIKELIIGDNSDRVNVKKIQGKRGDYYRIAIAGYRVVYTVINGKIIVVNVVLAGARGDVYKKMKGLK